MPTTRHVDHTQATMFPWRSWCTLAPAAWLLFEPALAKPKYDVKPYEINLTQGVPHILDLIKRTNLPAYPEYPGVGDSAGISLRTLTDLQREWLAEFDWKKEQDEINR